MSQPMSRQSRLYTSASIVSMIRSIDGSTLFTEQELVHIESLLRDELASNQWLCELCSAVIENSVAVTQQQLDLYERHTTDDRSVSISQFNELNAKLDFIKQKAKSLRYIEKDLNNKLTQILSENYEKENHCSDLILKELNNKLLNALKKLKTDINCFHDIKDPKNITEDIVKQLEGKCVTIDEAVDWFDQQLQELALTPINKSEVSEKISSELMNRLESLGLSLNNLYEECQRIKSYYETNVREEMCWRRDLKSVLNQIKQICEVEVTVPLHLSSCQTIDSNIKTKDLKTNSDLLEKVKSQESDQFQALMDLLKEKVGILENDIK